VTEPTIPELADLVRAGLDADTETAPGIHDKLCGKVLYGDPYGDAPCDCGRPARVLADAASKRALLDEVLGWRHQKAEDPFYSCRARPDIPEWVESGPRDCGRDDRVRAVLTHLAQSYQEQS
jgi:hypothetical protein